MKPTAVRWALLILWSSLAIAVSASLVYYGSSGVRVAFGDVASHLLGYVLQAALLFGIGARNAWARILFVVFLVLFIASLIFGGVRGFG